MRDDGADLRRENPFPEMKMLENRILPSIAFPLILQGIYVFAV